MHTRPEKPPTSIFKVPVTLSFTVDLCLNPFLRQETDKCHCVFVLTYTLYSNNMYIDTCTDYLKIIYKDAKEKEFGELERV